MRADLQHCGEIYEHYLSHWGRDVESLKFKKGPITALPDAFRVLRFPPRSERKMWTYATVGMSQSGDENRLELHMFAPEEREEVVELLVATAHYHRTGQSLKLGHSVNFGRPWLPGSQCDHGLISLPYLDGPQLEWLGSRDDGVKTRFLWLIPVTSGELAFARRNGRDALEEEFQKSRFNYLDPERRSVVEHLN